MMTKLSESIACGAMGQRLKSGTLDSWGCLFICGNGVSQLTIRYTHAQLHILLFNGQFPVQLRSASVSMSNHTRF